MQLFVKVSAKLTADGFTTIHSNVAGISDSTSNQLALLTEILAEDFLEEVKKNEKGSIYRQSRGLCSIPAGDAQVVEA